MSCGIGHRCGSDPALLWLWHRLVAVVPIWPLHWELPYAAGATLKRPKKKKKRSVWNTDPSATAILHMPTPWTLALQPLCLPACPCPRPQHQKESTWLWIPLAEKKRAERSQQLVHWGPLQALPMLSSVDGTTQVYLLYCGSRTTAAPPAGALTPTHRWRSFPDWSQTIKSGRRNCSLKCTDSNERLQEDEKSKKHDTTQRIQ